METPLRLTFRHADHSDALAARTHELVGRLARLQPHMTDCHVTVEGPSGRHVKGGTFAVSIDISLPKSSVHVDTARSPKAAHADPYIALRDAYDIAKRQLRTAIHETHS